MLQRIVATFVPIVSHPSPITHLWDLAQSECELRQCSSWPGLNSVHCMKSAQISNPCAVNTRESNHLWNYGNCSFLMKEGRQSIQCDTYAYVSEGISQNVASFQVPERSLTKPSNSKWHHSSSLCVLNFHFLLLALREKLNKWKQFSWLSSNYINLCGESHIVNVFLTRMAPK